MRPVCQITLTTHHHSSSPTTLLESQVHEQLADGREDGTLVIELVEVMEPFQQVVDGDGRRRRRER